MALTKSEWYSMKFPYTDDIGLVWVDPDGFLAEKAGPCFICKVPTKRVDLAYEGHFCTSDECNEEIRKDLKSYEVTGE